MTHLVPVLRPVLGSPFRRAGLYRAAGEIPSWHIAPVRTGTVTDLITGSQIITFTNSSPAWGFNSSGVLVQPTANVPFIEYDPATGTCLGWRVWDAVTNLLTYSNDFTQTAWAKIVGGTGTTPVVTSNYALSPDGTMNATRLQCNRGASSTSSDSSYIQQAISGLPSTHTTATSIWIRSNTGSSQNVYFRNATGAGGTSFVATNTWQRVSTIGTRTGNTADNLQIGCRQANSDSSIDILIYGSQIQQSDQLGPYVPTGALTASSTADVASILSWAAANNIRSAYIRGRTTATGTRGLLSGNDNSSSNRIEAITSGTDPRLQVTTSGSSVADIDGGTVVANTPFRMAMRFAANDFAVSVNGGAVVTDTSGGLPTIDRWFLGRTQAGEYGNCYIDEMALFTGLISDSRLTAMAAQ